MQITTLLLIVLAALIALGLVFFQYYYKTKRKEKYVILLSILRFLAIFCLFLLLINPKFSKTEYTLEKTKLVLLTDNSTSMLDYKNEVKNVLNTFNNNDLSERFEIENYQFGNNVSLRTDSLSFSNTQTNISKALATLKDIYSTSNTAIILMSDGNQTIGTDYEFEGNRSNLPIFPVVIGDTTQYEDLRIERVTVNKYAFLKNKFPIEIIVSYDGNASISSTLSITINGKTQHRETLQLSKNNNTKIVSTQLEATNVGVKTISVNLQPLNAERNIANNIKKVAIEVVDEKTNIAIISNILHPDIGALTKAIESNEQRSVSVLKPTTTIDELEAIDVFLLYQPNTTFKKIVEYSKKKKASTFIIGGINTDWRFLNSLDSEIRIEGGYPTQEIIPILNPSFSKFDISKTTTEDFPPIESNAGPVGLAGDYEALVNMKIKGKVMNSPLLFAHESSNGKKIVLLGENIWKWRMQSFRNNQNFENFDNLIGKLILYLSNSTSKSRLNIDYQRIYEGSADAKITATYFDEAFVFDANANISLHIKEKNGAFTKEIPMLLQSNNYEADLSILPAGEYNFTITVANENKSKSGSFTIMNFDVEQQFFSADYKKLNHLANNSQGALFYPNQIDGLIGDLTQANRFAPIQKGTKNIVYLIDYRILMGLIVLFLTLEWFIRKYNGLI